MSAPVIQVTHREAQVAYALVYDGADNPLIARRLGVSEHTVKHHIKHLAKKTGAFNRTNLALMIVKGEVILRGPIPRLVGTSENRFHGPTPFDRGRRVPCPAPRSSADGSAAESAL